MTTTRRWWVFALVCLALFMGALDSLVVTTALPAIGRALHSRLSDLEWTVNSKALADCGRCYNPQYSHNSSPNGARLSSSR